MFSVYLSQVETEIKQLFNDDSEYEKFLNHKIDYEINSFLASFIGESLLHGCVGHHAYIKINIKNREYLIEFTPPANRYQRSSGSKRNKNNKW